MAGEWRASTWGDEISLEYGKALRGHDTGHGPYRVFGANGPIGWTREPLAKGPGVILGRKGAYRGVQYSREPFFVIDTAYYVIPKTELDMRWLYYAIQHYKLGEVDDGSPIPSTTRAAVYMLDLDVPPHDEQRAIVSILGTLDDKIELSRRIAATLEEMARALFKSWFIDFDPVRAKAEGRPTGLPPEIDALFPDSFVDSELGPIPDGWEVGSLTNLATISKMQLNPSSQPDTLFDHYSIPAYDAGRTPSKELGSTILSQKFLVLPGAVLVSKLNPEIPRVWLADKNVASAAICSTEFIVLLAEPPATSSYLYCLALSKPFRRVMESRVTGTSKSHQRSQPSSVMQARIVVPPGAIHETFDKATSCLLARRSLLLRKSDGIGALRDLLLPKLISGNMSLYDHNTS